MTSIAQHLSTLVGSAFASLGLPETLGEVRVSDRPDLAQFQCNGAMGAAKLAKKAPRAVAEEVVAFLQNTPELAQIELAGPGFINLSVTPDYLARTLITLSADAQCGVPQRGTGVTIVLDYGGPNIAKAMHVGHLRASIIGDTLRRMYGFAGYTTLGDVHLGDWGLPMGQLLSALELAYPDWPYFDPSYTGEYPTEPPVSIEDLATLYPQASAACKEDPERLALARTATAKLQDGVPGYRALWQHFFDVSIASVKDNFGALGVHFDLWLGESDAHDTIAPMVEDLKARGIAQHSDGALVVHVAQDGDTKEIPPLIVLKSDGAVMYGTTDLSTIADRVTDHAPSQIIYCVDNRQSLHFEQVFRAARKGGIAGDDIALVHAGFGTMNGPDGKPFKTRAGGTMHLTDLIALAVEKATQRLDEADLARDMDAVGRAEIARKVGIAALKFADLQNNRTSDYIFDLERMTAFEGKTGPYLLYQVVRIRSLLRKAEGRGFLPQEQDLVIGTEETALGLLLAEFPDHFALALRENTPHVLCDYAHRLAQSFSSFYAKCHIVSEQDEALRGSRLQLCALTARQLSVILGLLGIDIPERM